MAAGNRAEAEHENLAISAVLDLPEADIRRRISNC
jgi:hypothetical protein